MAVMGWQPRALLAVGAVAAVTLYTWHRLTAHRRRLRQRAREDQTYDLVIDVCGAPDRAPWPVEIHQPYEPNLDVVGVCVLGDFKVGKTFLINRLCNLNLCSIESHHTKGLSFKRGRPPRNQVVWIDTAGHGCPYDIRRETVEDRSQTENLLSELAYRLADVRIVVVSNCKLRDQEFIFSLHKQIKEDAQPGKDLLIVVHNYTRIGDPQLLLAAFKTDVVSRFNIQEVCVPYRFSNTAHKRIWVDRSDLYPIFHLFLGQEGTPAGNKFNEQTFNAIFDLCMDRLGYNIRHNFLDDTLQLANDGLLAQHLGCPRAVAYDAARGHIAVKEDDPDADTNNCHSMPPGPLPTPPLPLPSPRPAPNDEPYYTFHS